jgi:hypothetical protein
MMNRKIAICVSSMLLLCASGRAPNSYPLHHDITATEFWAGEPADRDNGNISNTQSAWDGLWEAHYGGVDDPAHRTGYLPSAFVPKENPFYFALPYDDFDDNGNRRKDVARVIPWFDERPWTANESMCKNRWIRIMQGGHICYAQWEDVGPYEEADSAYVFGKSQPTSAQNNHAGLDLSPAVTDYLHLNGEQKVDWAFVDGADVPRGPWTQIQTTSQIDWN